MSEPDAEGRRTLSFEVNGSVREISILDEKRAVKADNKLKADKTNPAHVGSSIPGTIEKVFVKEGDTVEQNQPLVVIEAMKMETTIVAKQAGTIDKVYVKEKDRVSTGDLLISFEKQN